MLFQARGWGQSLSLSLSRSLSLWGLTLRGFPGSLCFEDSFARVQSLVGALRFGGFLGGSAPRDPKPGAAAA